VIRYQDSLNTTQYQGYCIDLIQRISERLNFNYSLYETADQMQGSMNSRKEWNGLILDLMRGVMFYLQFLFATVIIVNIFSTNKISNWWIQARLTIFCMIIKNIMFQDADIALGPLTVRADRENVVDFTLPYFYPVGNLILMKKTHAIDHSLFKFMKILEPWAWLCIAAAYLTTSLFLWLLDRFSPHSETNKNLRADDTIVKHQGLRNFNLKECLWFCITSLTPQGRFGCIAMIHYIFGCNDTLLTSISR